MTRKHFTEEIDSYSVLILRLDEYRPSAHVLAEGFSFLSPEKYDTVRSQERRLLQQFFDDWDIPYCHKLRGYREDSPIFVMQGERLAGGAYLCDKNEFDENSSIGQVHYVFVAPEFRGRGIYSVAFGEAVKRAKSWGLEQIYFNTDRYLLPEVHSRWGMKPWKQIKKSSHLPHNALGNLVRRLYWRARRVWQSFKPPSA